MFLIVGLGNIGEKYSLTRHNVGFMVADAAIKNLTSSTNINKSNFNATVIKSDETLFVKPTTFMNNSGISARAIKDYYKIENKNIIVIHDDLDLPFGTVKFKIGGGHGGHNGLRSLDANIGNDYIRIRIGIGKPQNKEEVVNFVLSNFSKEELNKLEDIISHTLEAIEFIKNGNSMNEVKSKFTLK
ncbi:MAG: aminoacyl-tRNA hydrolase [Candidatus Marinarcus sp.]|uniref:aminoacyl-tRNA hydrolase n=1 Tax=Candidatus Marinarcus sp. TaxID=3100987 RepID=UPI003B009372